MTRPGWDTEPPQLEIDATDTGALDEKLAALPNRPAVFLLWPGEGAPHLARTGQLRRRLLRLLGPRASRLANLRGVVTRVECWWTGSMLEAWLLHYRLARHCYPETYRQVIKLRFPPYVKITLDNAFPRTHITSHLARGPGLWFGPFQSRATAERFEAQTLDLFQLRRCQEDLTPSPDHPGCIYGEMGRCLRPCQEVVGPDEYRHEAERVAHFLQSGGKSLVEPTAAARDRFSAELDFEQAARQHRLLERIQAVLALRDELATDTDRLHGVAVTASHQEGAVDLRLVWQGVWQPVCRFPVADAGGQNLSLDRRLRELLQDFPVRTTSVRERQEHLALLARWFYSSWRDGDWIPFPSLDAVPYRKLVRAISRAAARRTP